MTPTDCGSCRFLTDATAARTSLPDLRAAADETALAVGPAEQLCAEAIRRAKAHRAADRMLARAVRFAGIKES